MIGFAHVTLSDIHELAPTGVQAELLCLYVQGPFTGLNFGAKLLAES